MTSPVSNTFPTGYIEQLRSTLADPNHRVELDPEGQQTSSELNRILVAHYALLDGEPVGTVKMHNDGRIARRVDEGDGPYWSILEINGTRSRDTSSRLGDGWTPVTTA